MLSESVTIVKHSFIWLVKSTPVYNIPQMYNQDMEIPSSLKELPSLENLSLLSGVLLLTLALNRFLALPEWDISIPLGGILINFKISSRTWAALLSAIITASSTYWLIALRHSTQVTSPWQHLILPTLTSWAIQLPLYQVETGYLWWMGYLMGGFLLLLIILSEYVSLDPQGRLYIFASSLLTAFSFGFFLVIVISLRFSGTRLFLIIPTIAITGYLVCRRALFFRFSGKDMNFQAVITVLITTQIAAAIHYNVISPFSFGLITMAPLYTLTNLISNLEEGDISLRTAVESITIMSILLILAGLIA